MESELNRLKKMVSEIRKEVIEKLKKKCGSEFKCCIYLDTTYDNPHLAHSDGFLLMNNPLLVCSLQISENKTTYFSDDLLRFIIGHEICHCILRKIDIIKMKKNIRFNDDKSLPEKVKIESSKIILSDLSYVEKICSDDVNIFQEDHKNLLKRIVRIKTNYDNWDPPNYHHKCYDLCTMRLLEISEGKILNFLNLLKNSLEDSNGDIEKRISVAQKMDYNDCKNYWL